MTVNKITRVAASRQSRSISQECTPLKITLTTFASKRGNFNYAILTNYERMKTEWEKLQILWKN